MRGPSPMPRTRSRRKVDLYVQYHRDGTANAAIGAKAEGAPASRCIAAQRRRVPGAPLYSARQCSRRAHRRRCARRSSPGAPGAGQTDGRRSCMGPLGAQAEGIPERVQGVDRGAQAQAACRNVRVSMLETQGNPAQVAPLLAHAVGRPNPRAKIADRRHRRRRRRWPPRPRVEAAGRAAATPPSSSHGVDRTHPRRRQRSQGARPDQSRQHRASGRWRSISTAWAISVLPLALRMLQRRGRPRRAPPAATQA